MSICLLIGGLNKIAQLSSVLFLLSYFTVNLACFILEWASTPNFRPSYHGYHMTTCIIGTLGCFVMMFVISYIFSSIALVLFFAFFILFNFSAGPK